VNPTWIAAAEQLAEDGGELGFSAAARVASAFRANCLPEATRNLMTAAYALAGEEVKLRFLDRVEPCATAEEFLTGAEELEGDAAALGKHAADMAAACETALEEAIGAHQAARRRMTAAQVNPGSRAARAEVAAALKAMRAAKRVIAECDAALDLICQVRERLEYVVRCFRCTPADFAEAYDVPLQHLRDGGTLPWSGTFLTAAQQVR